MQGGGDPVTYQVVGIFAGDGPVDGALGRTVIVPLQTAQAVFGGTSVTRVDIGLTDDAASAAVETALEERLTAEPYVLSSPADMAASLRASTTDFAVTTALIAAVALFAGALLIFNTLSMTVAERVREVGLLRAAGATRRQVMRYVFTQALILGVVGSLIGLALGVVLAMAIVSVMGTVGSVTIERPVLALEGVVLATLVGVGVTLAAAIEPSRRASRIQPVEALRARHDQRSAGTPRLRWLVVVFGLVALVGVVILPRAAGGAATVQALAVYARAARGDAPHPVPPADHGPDRGRPVRPLHARRGTPRPQRRRARPEPDDTDAGRIDDRTGDDRRARRCRPACPRRGSRLDRQRHPGRPRPDLHPSGDRRRGRRRGDRRHRAGRRPGQPDRHLRRRRRGQPHRCGCGRRVGPR